MTDDLIEFRGQQVHPGHPEKVKAAQQNPYVFIEDQPFNRHRYGDVPEPNFPPKPCHDCTVVLGELHVPGCDAECCPKCGGQLISCACNPHFDKEAE